MPSTAFHSNRIVVTTLGQGPDVIVIPGLASSRHVWDAEAAQLATHHRLHLVQVRGFAGEPAAGNASGPVLQPTIDALDEYIRASGLSHPAVIGHSLGGLMGLILAQQHPGDVGKLLVVDALPWFPLLFGPATTMEQASSAAASARDKILGQSQAAYAASAPSSMAMLVKSKGAATDAAIAAAAASDATVVARAFYEDMITDARPLLPSIAAAVRILYPWDATMGIPAAAQDERYRSAFAGLPRKELVRIDGSYHFIQIDQPAPLHREVEIFLRE